MSLKSLLPAIIVAAAAIAVTTGPALAQDNDGNSQNAGASASASTNQAIELAYHAAGVLYAQMHLPDSQRIPAKMLDGARCIAVFPAVFKEGFIVAGKNGNGIVGCRDDSGNWGAGAPAFFGLSGGSIGFQAGAQVTQLIILFMNKDAIDQLTSGNIDFGGKVSVAGGPAGAQANAHTAPASILTYRLKSSGGFAGADIKGASISANKDADDNIYGGTKNVKQLLLHHTEVPQTVKVFAQALQKFAPGDEFNPNLKVESASGQG